MMKVVYVSLGYLSDYNKEEKEQFRDHWLLGQKWLKDSCYYKDNQTSKESDKMIVTIQSLWISIKNMLKIKELNSKI